MDDALIAVIGMAVLGLGLLALQISRWLARKHWQARQPLAFLAEDFAFTRRSDRFVHDTRIEQFVGDYKNVAVEVESGTGPSRQYSRLDISPRELVTLGLQISPEHEDGLLTRVMRLREIEIGLHHFDSQFILLTRDVDHFRRIIDHKARNLLLSLRERLRDVRLDDRGLHLHLMGVLEQDDFLWYLDQGAALVEHVANRALELKRESTAGTEVDETPPAFTPIPGTLKAIGDTPADAEQGSKPDAT